MQIHVNRNGCYHANGCPKFQAYFFRTLATTQRITPTTMAIRINAHHIPALKIVSMAPQLLSARVTRNRLINKKNFMMTGLIRRRKFKDRTKCRSGCVVMIKFVFPEINLQRKVLPLMRINTKWAEKPSQHKNLFSFLPVFASSRLNRHVWRVIVLSE